MASEQAFVTLATNDQYALGALTWASSLKNVNTARKIVILTTDGLSQSIKNILPSFFDLVVEVNLCESNSASILDALNRPELKVTLTKIHCWNLTQFTKCVFMDADTLVIGNIDELFEKDELSAVPDSGWVDIFNSGVFVYVPSEQTFANLMKLAKEENSSFDGGDQGLLNTYFSDWRTKDIGRHLSFIYNMSLVASYSYLPAYKKFGNKVKVIHYLGSIKPWFYSYNASTGQLNSLSSNVVANDLIALWWKTYTAHVHPRLAELDLVSMVKSFSNMTFESTPSNPQQRWQEGHADYLGADSFANIQKKLDESISK